MGNPFGSVSVGEKQQLIQSLINQMCVVLEQLPKWAEWLYLGR